MKFSLNGKIIWSCCEAQKSSHNSHFTIFHLSHSLLLENLQNTTDKETTEEKDKEDYGLDFWDGYEMTQESRNVYFY